MTTFTRREMFRLAMALPPIGVFTRFNALVAADRNKVKITDVKAMQINRIAGNCLIKIETDAGIVGYGEAGMTGPMARARIATMKPLLVGKDPLAIEVHFQNMTSLMHTYMASIPTISGIDIALWDIELKMPLALHNVGSLVLTFANAHFGSAIHNFYRSESQLGETGYIAMAASNPPEVRKSYLTVPTGPGLGFEINPDFLKKNLVAGEEYWG